MKIQNHSEIFRNNICATEKPHSEIQQLQKSSFGGDILTRIWFYVEWSCLEPVCPESFGKLLWCGKCVQTVVLPFTSPRLAKWVQRHPLRRRKEPVSFVHCGTGIQMATSSRNLRPETSWKRKTVQFVVERCGSHSSTFLFIKWSYNASPVVYAGPCVRLSFHKVI